MFDWNDQELTNIIWDEGSESEDHIVPYTERDQEKAHGLYENLVHKEWNKEAANVKSVEQKKPVFKIEFYGDETARRGNGDEIFHNRKEVRVEGDFVDYGWANIGSFGDLDRIFSNDAPIFGHSSLCNADELWSSSQDAISSREKSMPFPMESPSSELGELRNLSEHFEVKTEYEVDQKQSSTTGYTKMNYVNCQPLHNLQGSRDQLVDAQGKSKLLINDKFSQTASEMVEKNPAFGSHLYSENVAIRNVFPGKDLCGIWPPSWNQFQQFDGHYAPQLGQPCPSPVLNQHRQLEGPQSPQYKNLSITFLSPSVYGNTANQYSTVPVLPQFHSGEGDPVKPLTMTPLEKIEKLRRQQQLRAILAISQQQQLSHQVSCTEQYVAQKCSNENQMPFNPGGNVQVEENMSPLPSFDPNLPIEQDDSNIDFMAIDDCSMDTVLHHLQDITAKLDIQIKLHIRDSLFRLAQSAMERKNASEASSTRKNSRDGVLTREEINSNNSFARIRDMETETNPIDRTVAHLLFHRPLEMPAEHHDTLE